MMFLGGGLFREPRILIRTKIAALVLVPLLAWAVPAQANRLNSVQVLRQGVHGIDGLAGVVSVTVSPDGKNVYSCSASHDAVAVFRRNRATGALRLAQMVRDGVDGVDGLAYATSVAISPDGAYAYVTGAAHNAVAVFRRAKRTGALSFVEVKKQQVAGVDGLTFARAVTVSPDGVNVYVAGQEDNAVAAFRRNPATGALSFMEVQRDGIDGVDGLAGVLSVTVSPDGSHLYAAGVDDSAVAVFRRDPATGALDFVEAQTEGGHGFGVTGVRSVTISPDGVYVYASGQGDDDIAVFRRDRNTGKLTLVEVKAEGVDGVTGLFGALWVALSPYGTHLYASGALDNAVAVFDRNPTTGTLSFAEAREGRSVPPGAHDLPQVRGLAITRAVAVSPDGKNIYVSGSRSDAMKVFRVGAK